MNVILHPCMTDPDRPQQAEKLSALLCDNNLVPVQSKRFDRIRLLTPEQAMIASAAADIDYSDLMSGAGIHD